MDMRTRLPGRFSLSTTNLSNPIAESTQINGSDSQTNFPYRTKPILQKQISLTANSRDNSQKSVLKIQMSPKNNIDSRIYTDINSKGLTSRIVKYHQNSMKMNRSLSVGNLYNKPGEFPVVHLKRNEIQYNPKNLHDVSITRIAPPDKSIFQANTRSSILRTGSIVPTIRLQNRVDAESRENKPIIHPAGNDLNPTRSVLDALKEISRKRINSDELDCNDGIKKYCMQLESASRRSILPYSPPYTSTISKRQRETNRSDDGKIHSPEQIVKRRMYGKNNDIMSSLSSSLSMNTPKRKFPDIQGRPAISSLNRYSPSDNSVSVSSLPKQQCIDNNYISMPNYKSEHFDTTNVQILPNQQINKNVSETIQTRNSFQHQKPKLTLFNKNYDEAVTNKYDQMEKSNSIIAKSKADEDEGLIGISFVKPKTKSPISSGKNVILERAQASKLALMLSCLKGELDDETDEVDIDTNKEDKQLQSTSYTLETQPPAYNEVAISTFVPSSIVNTAVTTAVSLPTVTTVSSAAISVSLTPGTEKLSTPISFKPSEPIIPVTSAPSGGFSFEIKSTEPKINASSTVTTSGSDNISERSINTKKLQPISSNVNSVNSSTTSSQMIDTTTITSTINPIITEAISFGTSNMTEVNTTQQQPNIVLPSTSATTNPMESNQMFPYAKKEPLSVATLPANTNTSSTPATNFGVSLGLVTSAPMFGFPSVSTFSSTTQAINPSNSFTSTYQNVTKFKSSPLEQKNQIATTTVPSLNATPIFSSVAKTQTFASISNQAPTFDNINNSSSFSNNPLFGTVAQQAGTNLFDVKSTSSNTGFAFGGTSTTIATTSASGGTNIFETKPTTTSPFGFSGADTIAQTNNNNKNCFNFSQKAASTVSSTPSKFSFGGSNLNSSSSKEAPIAIFGSGTNINHSTPMNNNPSVGGFNFNPSSATQAAVAGTGFGFNSNNENKTTSFGFNPSNSGNSLNDQNQTTNKPFAFASVSKMQDPIVFNSVGKNTSTETGVRSFSFSNPAPKAENTNLFGSMSVASSQPTSGFSNTFTFGNSGATNNSDPQPLSSTSTFGSNNPNALFGNSVNQPKPFSFRGGDSVISSKPSTNLFGNVTATNQNETPSLFSSTKSNTNSPFTFSNNQTQMANNESTHNANNAFAFGASSCGGSSTATDKPFNFVSNLQPASFGNVSTNPNKPPAFNFSGNSIAPSSGMTGVPLSEPNNAFNGPSANVFNIGTGGGTSANMANRRQIRTATRRLK